MPGSDYGGCVTRTGLIIGKPVQTERGPYSSVRGGAEGQNPESWVCRVLGHRGGSVQLWLPKIIK